MHLVVEIALLMKTMYVEQATAQRQDEHLRVHVAVMRLRQGRVAGVEDTGKDHTGHFVGKRASKA